MRSFDYRELNRIEVPADIVQLIAQIYEHKGRQALFVMQQPDKLSALLQVAKIQSTEASNRIEGIYTTPSRLKDLMEEKITPQNRNEEEIGGYRDVLDLIHSSYEFIPLTKGSILQLHKNLYRYSQTTQAGRWKRMDNLIEEVDQSGRRSIRFVPTPALEVEETMTNLSDAYASYAGRGGDSLISIFLFILDFLCVHPITDGNGRLSRLLMLLLLYKNGFVVGKYISIEQLIERSKESYYATLKESSFQWQDGNNDHFPFIRYSLGIILSAYVAFEERIVAVTILKLSKREQIVQLVSTHLGLLTKSQIKSDCPNVSVALIEKTLKELLDEGLIQKVGAGRSTGYLKIE